MEIERKYLVKSFPRGQKTGSGSHIRQGYFAVCDKEVEIRLREQGLKHFITIKAGRGKVRTEEEIRIDKRTFETLWPLVRTDSVVKRRHRIRHKGRLLEVDVYGGRHRGLMTAEVEFPTVGESKSFDPPAWLGREVTGQPRYSNESLARRGRRC